MNTPEQIAEKAAILWLGDKKAVYQLEYLKPIILSAINEATAAKDAEIERLKSNYVPSVQVAGNRLSGSNLDFERACLVHIERLQHEIGPYDSAMLDTFCEAVRMVREYSDMMQVKENTK